MCPVEYGVDMRVTTLFTILRLRRGERECGGRCAGQMAKVKSRTGLGEGTGAWRSRTYPPVAVFFAALGSGGDSPWGHVLPSGLKRIALEPRGGQTSLICSVGNGLRKKPSMAWGTEAPAGAIRARASRSCEAR